MKKQVLILIYTLLCFGAVAQSQNNEVYIEQVGESHRVTVLQAANGLAKFNVADIHQAGSGMNASVNQGSSAGSALRNHASIIQSGAGNEGLGLSGS